jgi:hypothetical protein
MVNWVPVYNTTEKTCKEKNANAENPSVPRGEVTGTGNLGPVIFWVPKGPEKIAQGLWSCN